MSDKTKSKLEQERIEEWSIKEKYFLARFVQKLGNQNWSLISRHVKPFGEKDRPADWFSPKSCALQYNDMLDKIEVPKRKRGERCDETVQDLLIKKYKELLSDGLHHEIKTRLLAMKDFVDETKDVKGEERSKIIKQAHEKVLAKIEQEQAAYQKLLKEREAKMVKTFPKTISRSSNKPRRGTGGKSKTVLKAMDDGSVIIEPEIVPVVENIPQNDIAVELNQVKKIDCPVVENQTILSSTKEVETVKVVAEEKPASETFCLNTEFLDEETIAYVENSETIAYVENEENPHNSKNCASMDNVENPETVIDSEKVENDTSVENSDTVANSENVDGDNYDAVANVKNVQSPENVQDSENVYVENENYDSVPNIEGDNPIMNDAVPNVKDDGNNDTVPNEEGEKCDAVPNLENDGNCDTVANVESKNYDAVPNEEGEKCDAVPNLENDGNCDTVANVEDKNYDAVKNEEGEKCDAVPSVDDGNCDTVANVEEDGNYETVANVDENSENLPVKIDVICESTDIDCNNEESRETNETLVDESIVKTDSEELEPEKYEVEIELISESIDMENSSTTNDNQSDTIETVIEPKVASPDCVIVSPERNPSVDLSGDIVIVSPERNPNVDLSGDIVIVSPERNPNVDLSGDIVILSPERNPSVDSSGDIVIVSDGRNPGVDLSGDIVIVSPERNPNVDLSGDIVIVSPERNPSVKLSRKSRKRSHLINNSDSQIQTRITRSQVNIMLQSEKSEAMETLSNEKDRNNSDVVIVSENHSVTSHSEESSDSRANSFDINPQESEIDFKWKKGAMMFVRTIQNHPSSHLLFDRSHENANRCVIENIDLNFIRKSLETGKIKSFDEFEYYVYLLFYYSKIVNDNPSDGIVIDEFFKEIMELMNESDYKTRTREKDQENSPEVKKSLRRQTRSSASSSFSG